MNFLTSFELLQVSAGNPSKTTLRAIDFLGQIARSCGATVLVAPDFPSDKDAFTGRGKSAWTPAAGETSGDWAAAKPNRILLVANSDASLDGVLSGNDVSAVEIFMESWQSENTLFASSAIAHLLGEPDREPLVPAGHVAACSIAYAGYTALAALVNSMRRMGTKDIARVNGVAAMSWVNWKAAEVAGTPSEMHRRGNAASWPVVEAKDGFFTFNYSDGHWPGFLEMVDDEAFKAPIFETPAKVRENQAEVNAAIRRWAATKTCAELVALCAGHGVPGAPAITAGETMEDPLFLHREAFETVTRSDGKTVKAFRAPHRIQRVESNPGEPSPRKAGDHLTPAGANLPLSGVRVLDMGIITAGAGTGALLADMGAEVLKIESDTYPDPFRKWPGFGEDSPLFKFNNRNKNGLAINLKTEAGKKEFLRLVASADVVMENFRRGVLDRMGFSLDVLREANPNIVLASISAQGLDGPGCNAPTYGTTLEASSGFAMLTCYEDRHPYTTARLINYPDQTVCMYASATIALAILAARENNCALHVDVSQRDVAAYNLADVIEMVSAGVPDDVDAIRTACADNEIEGMFRSKDDQWVAVAVDSLAMLKGAAELGGIDSEQALAEWVKQHSSAEVETILRANGIGVATELGGGEMKELDIVKEMQVFGYSASGTLVKGFPFTLGKTAMKIWREAPKVGEDNAKYLSADMLAQG